MERLTNNAINNLLAMSKYDYHMYGLDIKTALSELKEYRTTGLMPEEVAALKADNERLSKENGAAIRDMRLMTGLCRVCSKYRISCKPRHDELDGCATFEWRGLEGNHDQN